MEHPGFSSRQDGLQLVRGDREGGSIPCCPTWALEMHLLCRARSISGGEHRWVVSCDAGSAHAALTYFVPGRNRGGWQLVPVLGASGRASLCASARAAWVPKPCPRPELGRSVAPLWRNAGFPLPSWDSLKVVLMRVVLEAPDRAAREGMVVLGALWPRCSCCCLGLRGLLKVRAYQSLISFSCYSLGGHSSGSHHLLCLCVLGGAPAAPSMGSLVFLLVMH